MKKMGLKIEGLGSIAGCGESHVLRLVFDTAAVHWGRWGKTLSSLQVVRPGRHFYTARMKITTTLLKGTAIFATAALCALGQTARAADEPTALSLIKDANEYVGKDVKDKVIGLRSEKSVASLTPNIWYVVYYDHDATFKTTEVKYGAGK
jgi:hypothetical protein